MSFALQAVRPETHRIFQSCRRIADPVRPSWRKRIIMGYFLYYKVFMPLQKTADRLFILIRCKGTCRINHHASRLQHFSRPVQDHSLPVRTHPYMTGAPLLCRCLVFPKHAFSGTRSIHHDPVKKVRKQIGHMLWRFIAHHAIPNSHTLHILRQDLRTSRNHFIGYKQAFSLHPARNLCALAAGRRAQIKNTFPGHGV